MVYSSQFHFAEERSCAVGGERIGDVTAERLWFR
jgi:hypothetical protein